MLVGAPWRVVCRRARAAHAGDAAREPSPGHGHPDRQGPRGRLVRLGPGAADAGPEPGHRESDRAHGILAPVSRGGLPWVRRSCVAWRGPGGDRRGSGLPSRLDGAAGGADLNVGILLLVFIRSWASRPCRTREGPGRRLGLDDRRRRIARCLCCAAGLLDLALLAAAFARFRRSRLGARLTEGGAPGTSCFWR